MRIRYFLFIFLLSAPACSGYAQKKEFTILSYNVLEGFRNDTALKTKFVNWVKPKDPDLIFFQEMNKFTQKSLEELALRYGHHYAVLSKEAGYPVAITSKYPIVNVQKVVDNMWHAYIYASVHGYDVFAIHFSPHQFQKRIYEAQEIVYHASLLPKSSKVIVAGDFNSLSEKDKAFYTSEVLEKAKETEKRLSNIRNLNNGDFDFSVPRIFENAGFIDSYWKVNGDKPKPYNRRIDYIFLSRNLSSKISSSQFIYDDVTKDLSDHKPIIMTLKSDN